MRTYDQKTFYMLFTGLHDQILATQVENLNQAVMQDLFGADGPKIGDSVIHRFFDTFDNGRYIATDVRFTIVAVDGEINIQIENAIFYDNVLEYEKAIEQLDSDDNFTRINDGEEE